MFVSHTFPIASTIVQYLNCLPRLKILLLKAFEIKSLSTDFVNKYRYFSDEFLPHVRNYVSLLKTVFLE